MEPHNILQPTQQSHLGPSTSKNQQHHLQLSFEQETLLRLQYDYDFVHALTQPVYLKHLAEKGYFSEQSFIHYLEYLYGYWQKAEYLRLLKIPHAVDILRMLQDPAVRKELVDSQGNDFDMFANLISQ